MPLLGVNGGIVKTYGKQFGDAIGAHGHTVEYVGVGHGLAIVSDNDKL